LRAVARRIRNASSRANHANVILTPVNANRNPFIYLNNMGKVMTSTGALARWIAAAGAIAFALGSPARAETGAWAEAAHAKVRLVAAAPATALADTVTLGLEIKLEPGWKTYWRAPGEGGLPPRFDWNGSANLAGIAVSWPAPKRFEIGGMESIGYADHVILPLEARLARPGEPLALKLALRYAVCREICMLVEANLTLDLPMAQAGGQSEHAASIARFQARVPRPGAEHGWRIAGTSRKTMGEGSERRDLVVVDVVAGAAPFEAPELLIEGPGIRVGKAMQKPAPDGAHRRFVAAIQASGTPAGDLVLTLIDGKRAGTFTVPVPR
jgi:suppressor for copper-sensitivity B